MTNQLDITNVINISVSSSTTALQAFNTSNLCLFSSETPTGSFPAAGYQLYLSPTQVGIDFGTSSITYQMAVAVFAQQPNILTGGGYLAVVTFITSETIDQAILRTRNLVGFFGCMSTIIHTQTDMLAAAADLQSYNLMGFFVQRTTASIATGGALDLLRSGSLTHSRGLFYDSSTDLPALLYQAAYASRALSTNFNGSNTTQTMHLKSLATIQPDPAITQSILTTAIAAGADTYVSIQGIPVTFCSGLNSFYDSVYNLAWFIGGLEVAGFNYLTGASTKIAQTEAGMAGLRAAYGSVCVQATANQYAAPGVWTSATTFGRPGDLIANIANVGWYIYSSPVASQANSARIARQAPLCQIAVKEAGAIHSSSVIVNVNQ